LPPVGSSTWSEPNRRMRVAISTTATDPSIALAAIATILVSGSGSASSVARFPGAPGMCVLPARTDLVGGSAPYLRPSVRVGIGSTSTAIPPPGQGNVLALAPTGATGILRVDSAESGSTATTTSASDGSSVGSPGARTPGRSGTIATQLAARNLAERAATAMPPVHVHEGKDGI